MDIKRTVCGLCLAILCFSLVACGQSETAGTTEAETTVFVEAGAKLNSIDDSTTGLGAEATTMAPTKIETTTKIQTLAEFSPDWAVIGEKYECYFSTGGGYTNNLKIPDSILAKKKFDFDSDGADEYLVIYAEAYSGEHRGADSSKKLRLEMYEYAGGTLTLSDAIDTVHIDMETIDFYYNGKLANEGGFLYSEDLTLFNTDTEISNIFIYKDRLVCIDSCYSSKLSDGGFAQFAAYQYTEGKFVRKACAYEAGSGDAGLGESYNHYLSAFGINAKFWDVCYGTTKTAYDYAENAELLFHDKIYSPDIQKNLDKVDWGSESQNDTYDEMVAKSTIKVTVTRTLDNA